MAKNVDLSRNGQDPIFGGENSKMDCNEEAIGIPDQDLETVNIVSSSHSSLLVTRKRKGSDHREYDQVHRVSKKRYFEDGYQNISKGLRQLFLFNYSIFTNPDKEERKGSECDVSSLMTTFTKFGYEIVSSYLNLSYEETFSRLTEIQQRCNEGGIHMIVIAFMSHGDGKDPDNFLTSDVKSVPMSQVRYMFSNGNCEGLLGKPKIFLGIFCRDILQSPEDIFQPSPAIGLERSQSNPSSFENDEDEFYRLIKEVDLMGTEAADCDHKSMMGTDGKKCSPSVLKAEDLEDMTTLFSSKPGTVSFRHHRTGSVMVQCLCKVLSEKGDTHHLNDLYRFLQKEMKAVQKRASSEYIFTPDRDDLELKTCFFTDV